VGTRRYTIKQLPPELRPRERLLSEGPEALSSAELLAILLGTGSKENTAVALAGQVISESGDLFGLHGVSMQVRKHKTVRAAFLRCAGQRCFGGTLRANSSELVLQESIVRWKQKKRYSYSPTCEEGTSSEVRLWLAIL
jgi:DNA repair protein RadC